LRILCALCGSYFKTARNARNKYNKPFEPGYSHKSLCEFFAHSAVLILKPQGTQEINTINLLNQAIPTNPFADSLRPLQLIIFLAAKNAGEKIKALT
jgi:hypothetical protein